MSTLHRFAIAAFGIACFALEAGADPGWQVTGSNSSRIEHYDVDGAQNASPYAFEGGQAFNEFNLNLNRRFSPYRSLKGQLYGVLNDSNYRFPDNGLQAERLSLVYENGESNLPYRFEGGDVYTYLSYRTVQRSIKGIQLDMQPRVDDNGRRHSFLVFSGANQNRWNDFEYSDSQSSGASWLVEDGELGSLNLNIVNTQESARSVGELDREQWLASVAAETNFNLGAHNINLESEFVYFDGDHDGDFGAATGQGRDDHGIFAELVGNAYQNFSYRLRYEEYGYDFRPSASVVVNDRRSYEAHAAWQFAQGLRLRGRLQTYQDRFDSLNQLDTDVLGIDLSGSLTAFGLARHSGRLRAYREETEDEFGAVDRSSVGLDLNVTSPLSGKLNLMTDLGLLDQKDRLDSSLDAITSELGIAVSRQVALGEFFGNVSFGLQYRDIDGGLREGNEISPRIAFNLGDGTHTLRFSLDYLDQSRRETVDPDLRTATASLHYDLRWKQHEFGFEADYFDRHVDLADNTAASRVAVYWTWYFDGKSTARLAGAGGVNLNPASGLDERLEISSPALLAQLAPGQWLDQVVDKMLDASAPQPVVDTDGLVYEFPVLGRIDQRQRLAVTFRAQVVDRIGLIIDLENDGSPRSAGQLYSRVLEDLIKAYGRPQRDYSEGEFSENLVMDVNRDRFRRVTEWDTYYGVLRFGIPRRMDGKVRLEVQHLPRAIAVNDRFWSMDGVL
ncbi:MAG: hypothetical protein RJQ10_05880 [Haliea sp.]|uniref:hypothetical protein n=1 Tax=Haliea sp. TaxID=1932666 RepID=UPI0032EE2370